MWNHNMNIWLLIRYQKWDRHKTIKRVGKSLVWIISTWLTRTTRWSWSCCMIISQTAVFPEAAPPATPVFGKAYNKVSFIIIADLKTVNWNFIKKNQKSNVVYHFAKWKKEEKKLINLPEFVLKHIIVKTHKKAVWAKGHIRTLCWWKAIKIQWSNFNGNQ